MIKTFNSASGSWSIVKGEKKSNGGHTDGTINLDNATNKMRVIGASAGVECSLPDLTWVPLPIHGNLPNLKTGSFEEESSLSFVFPNPLDETGFIQMAEELSNATITIYDFHGRIIFRSEPFSGNLFPIDLDKAVPGIYLYRIIEYEREWSKGKFIVN